MFAHHAQTRPNYGVQFDMKLDMWRGQVIGWVLLSCGLSLAGNQRKFTQILLLIIIYNRFLLQNNCPNNAKAIFIYSVAKHDVLFISHYYIIIQIVNKQ